MPVVGALPEPLPAPCPCAAAVVPNIAKAIAVAAQSEDLCMVWNPSGTCESKNDAFRARLANGLPVRGLRDRQVAPPRGGSSKNAVRVSGLEECQVRGDVKSPVASGLAHETSRSPSVSSIETPHGSTIRAVGRLFIAGSFPYGFVSLMPFDSTSLVNASSPLTSKPT